jgi:hypothetical protein
MTMAEREIASIVWHRDGHHIDVIYVEGEPEHLVGTEMAATEMALTSQLHLVPTTDGTVRWVRDPGSWVP